MIALLVLVSTAISCSGSQKYSNISDVAASPNQSALLLAGRAGEVTQADRDFVYRATVYDLYCTQSSLLAEGRASKTTIGAFARQAADDCLAQSKELKRIATVYDDTTPPTKVDKERWMMLDHLSTLTGDAFDRAYIDSLVRETSQAVELFRKHAVSGSEPVLQHFAADEAPTLEQRLRAAQEMGAQLSR
jgi:putative membrane protein